MKRAYAVIMRDCDYKFIGVYTVVDTIEKAEEIIESSFLSIFKNKKKEE